LKIAGLIAYFYLFFSHPEHLLIYFFVLFFLQGSELSL